MDLSIQQAPQTPQKSFPGAFFSTPGPLKAVGPRTAPAPSAPPNQLDASQARRGSLFQPASEPPASQVPKAPSMTAIERAARAVNAALEEEGRYPALDNYISQGYSSDYDIPISPAWAPFQKVKIYDIPDRIFEQYNQAQVSTMMGLFAELNHAWISIDNSLYLWDYTNPNPELIGFEEQPNSITAVKLVKPRPGVFVEQISHLLVVATTADIFLIGVSCQTAPGGVKQVSLYQTRMQVSIRGISVSCITGSAKTGRIFFSGRNDDDVYELTYQQEEKWFQNRCARVNHTRKGFTSVLPALPFSQKTQPEFGVQMTVDDTRNLLYTLSSRSTIRVFSFKNPNELSLCITRTHSSIMSDLGHRVPPTSLFGASIPLVSVSPISAREASRITLMATTSTGCRIFFSTVSNVYYGGDGTAPPTSMQVHHVRFPPRDPAITASEQQQQSNPNMAFRDPPSADAAKSLTQSRISERLPPGYFLCFVQKTPQMSSDILFMSAPDAGRIAHPQDPSQANKYPEFGLWLTLESRAEDVGQVSPPFGATSTPIGFGNELAVQYDQPVTEIAILTNSGVHTFRRRRMVDIFAAAIRYGDGDEGLDGEIRTFVRLYGRGETMATALAVLCHQATDVTTDARVARITDPNVITYAKKAFTDHGGKPLLNENSVIDQGAPAIDNVRPSPRHEGLALYVSRLLRSIWKAPVVMVMQTPTGGQQILPTIPLSKLHIIQQDLGALQHFLNSHRSSIEGLAGPEALNRVSTKQEEVALQGEHRALSSMVTLIDNVIEGISFALVLFDERLDEIFLSIPDQARQQLRQTSYERLFCTPEGKDLAKELVKAIVNRNIAQGSNVDTVTDALRRRCGSFCSADDCVIFKAQEQLKRASDTSASSEASRNLLNESLRLLQKVAASLSMEQLRWAVEQYIPMQFFAGAIQLALAVAQESDRGNRALAWLNEGSPAEDNRRGAYDSRTKCYDLIHQVINAVDHVSEFNVNASDSQYTLTTARVREAYDIVNGSKDEVFQINLYDWYLAQGWSDRLLEIQSSFVLSYLKRKAVEDVTHADLLWRYHAHFHNYLEAAQVQLWLAKTGPDLTLEQRIEYLSRARANASIKTLGLTEVARGRQTRQELIREASDLLDVAGIQGDLLQRMRGESRLTADRRPQVLRALNGSILPLEELYNSYIDQAGYYDLALIVYHLADHRVPADIRSTWQNLIDVTHQETAAAGEPLPYEAVAERVRVLGARLNLSEGIFHTHTILPMLERYAFEFQRNIGPPTWVIDIFLDLGVPHETLLGSLEAVFFADEVPFRARNRRSIARDIAHVVAVWFAAGAAMAGLGGSGAGAGVGGVGLPLGGERLFGSEENAAAVSELMAAITGEDAASLGVERSEMEEWKVLRARVEACLRR